MRHTQDYCCICGAPAPEHRSPRLEKANPWTSNERYVIAEAYLEDFDENGRRFPSNTPFLSPEIIVTEDGPLIPKIWEFSSERFIQPKFQFSSHHNLNGPGGYPIHEGCWRILNPLINDSDVNLYDRMSTFRRILAGTSLVLSGRKLLWPHGYHGLSATGAQSEKWGPTPEVKYVNKNPWVIDDNPTLLKIASIKRQNRQVLCVPRILPLPVELVQRVYGYLDWSDIGNLLLVKTAVDVKAPASYWRTLFQPRAEFGYFGLDESVEANQGLSLFQKFCIARAQQVGQSDALKNRRRIWNICRELADQIIDISSCQLHGLDHTDSSNAFSIILEPSPAKPNIWVQCEGHICHGMEDYPRVFQGSKAIYEGEIDVESIDALRLSYAGTGSMSFLSGITVLPSGKQLGYITNRTRLVPWVSRTVLSVAVSRYGIVDISLSDSVHGPNWTLVDEDFEKREIAVKYRFLKCTDTVDSVKIQGKWDVSKMTEIRLSTFQIVDDLSLNSKREIFLQQHAWAPGIPSDDLYISPQSYAGAPYIWPGTPRYCPLRYVLFPPPSYMTLITAWSISSRISALVFRFTGHPPVTLGVCRGTPSDFPINGAAGEQIATIHVLLHNDHPDSMCGILFETNTWRKALFGVLKPDNCHERRILPAQGPRLQGLYGVVREFWLSTYDISSIGVITSRTDDDDDTNACPPPPPPFDINDSRIENATYVEHIRRAQINSKIIARYGDYHYRTRSIHVGYIKQFANKATFKDCHRILFYSRNCPDMRIVGMKLYYSDDVRECGNPRILGRISGGIEEPTALELPEDGSVFICRLTVYVRQLQWGDSRGNTSVCGLRVETSNGESRLWGTMDAGEVVTQRRDLKLQRESIIRWDYNQIFDIISVIDEEENQDEENDE
ncbi:hypothetical protein TWF506_003685 [Arthrobotrys conoides]|uniref:F-box domain-containing protein n=1 Tax=Arthrobotrys conoides TaxID=74498 RepID=A0AAN8RQL5_9PEZI